MSRVAIGLGILVGLIAVAGVVLHFVDLPGQAPSSSFGDIYVDQPEIYTRERLVNDRVKQDEWLQRRLAMTDQLTFAVQGSRAVLDRGTRGAGTTAGVEVADAGVGASPMPSASAAPVEQAPIDDLRDRLAYRDEVRGEIIENQLDDSHDVTGNTLYHMKFDTAIIPHDGVTAYAVVTALVSSTYSGISLDCNADNGLIQPTEFDRCIKLFLDLEPLAAKTKTKAKKVPPKEKVTQLYELYRDWLDRASVELNGIMTLHRDAIASGLRSVAAAVAPVAKQGVPAGNLPNPVLNDVDAASLEKFTAYLRDKVPNGGRSCPERETAGISASYLEAIGCLLNALSPRGANRKAADIPSALNEQFAAWLAEQAEWFAVKTAQDQFTRYQPFAQLVAENGKLKLFPRRAAVSEAQPSGSKWLADAAAYKFVEVVLRKATTSSTTGTDTAPHAAGGPPSTVTHPTSGAVPVEFDRYDRAIGFVEFLTRLLRAANHAYTYAVQPKESAQRVASVRDSLSVSNLMLAAGAQLDAVALKSALADSAARGELTNAIERHPLIVGFSDDAFHGPTDPGAYFGWLIGPRFRSGERPGAPVFEQQPEHNSLAAIVSAPSWWRSMRVALLTYWLTPSGRCIGLRRTLTDCSAVSTALEAAATESEPEPKTSAATEPDPKTPVAADAFEVQLPGDQDSIEDVLFNSGRKKLPLVLTDRMETAFIRAGEDAHIVIPGRYLWRSTLVTLGNNYTTDITVLPDMNGVIAHFKNVPWPPTDLPLAKNPYQYLPLEIWTSEGRVSIGWNKVLIFPPESKSASGAATSAATTSAAPTVPPAPSKATH